MAPESRVVSVLGLRVVGGEALLDALHLLQSVPAVLQTEFDRSRSSDRNPKFHKLISSTNKQRPNKKETAFFCLFICLSLEFFHHLLLLLFGCRGVVAVSTTRTSHRLKDSIQLRDSTRTLSLWIRSSLTDGFRNFPL
ncbi:unnamed protein product [Sphagnum jensenii]|uniref:Uncharacterized protein n=1 Tax=Sphagnum jensenii TaxID=128206 RepID=A0ABP0VLN4_9BRYO